MKTARWSRTLAWVTVSSAVLWLGAVQAPKAAPAAREATAKTASGAVPQSARIITHAPQGLVTENTELQVTFDRPVVALGAEVSRDGLTIATQPALKGQLRWSAPNLLVFAPDGFVPATHYTVRVEWHGKGACPVANLQSEGTWSFDTPGLELQAAASRDRFPIAKLRPIVIRVSQPATAADLASYLRVSWSPISYGDPRESPDAENSNEATDNGAAPSSATQMPPRTPIDVRVERGTALDLKHSFSNDGTEPTGNQAAFLVYPRKPWPLGAMVWIDLLPGDHGPLGRATPRGSHVQIDTEAGLQISGTLCDPNDGCVLGESLSVDFGTEISKAELAKVRFEPRPSEFEMHFGDKDAKTGTDIVLHGVFLAGQTYRLTVPADFHDTNGHRLGETTGGQAVTKTFSFKTRPMLVVSPQSGVFAQPKQATIGLQTRFLSSVALSALQLSDETTYQLHTSSIPLAQRQLVPNAPLVATRNLVEKGPNGWAEEVVDLDELIKGKRGMFAFEVRATAQSPRASGDLPEPVVRYYQRTDLAPIVWVSPRRLAVLALGHSDLKPLAGADVTLFTHAEPRGKSVGPTGPDGMLVVSEQKGLGEEPLLVLAQASTKDRRYSQLPESRDWESPKLDPKLRNPKLRSGESVMVYASVERDLLRPGDNVHVLGWALLDSPEAATGLRYLPAGVPVKLELWDGQHKLVEQKAAQTDVFGKFNAELQVPKEAGLGRGHILVRAMDHDEKVSLRIEDVRPPAFEVKVNTQTAVLRGQPISMSVSARQLSGESTTISSISLAVSCIGERTAPIPLEPDWVAEMPSARREIPAKHWDKEGPLEEGQYSDSVDSATLTEPDIPSSCRVDADVTNLVREHVGESNGTVVHPAPHYLAMTRLDDRYGLAPEKPVVVVLGAFDTNGKRVSVGTVEVNAITVEPKPRVVARCAAQVTAENDATCRLGKLAPGGYTLVAKGRRGTLVGFETGVSVNEPEPPRQDAPEDSTPTPNALAAARASLVLQVPKGPLSTGDRLTARISATNDGYGVLIVGRSGIRESHLFQVRGGTAVVPLITKESWVPNVTIRVAMPLRGSGSSRPYTAEDSGDLSIRPNKRILQIQIKAPAEARPGSQVPIELSVRDAENHPQPARVAIWAVDESYIQLTSYWVTHPLSQLVPRARRETRLYDPFAEDLEPYTPIGTDPSLIPDAFGIGGLGFGGGGMGQGIGLGNVGGIHMYQRKNFNPVPLYIADLATDAAGKAKVTLSLPDDLTRFRITALAAASMFDGSPGRFGTTDTELRVTQPVVLRAATPRLLRPSDVAEVAAIARNLTPSDGVLEVSARFLDTGNTSAAALTSDAQVKLPIHANQEIRVPFQVQARRPGNTKLAFSAVLHVPSNADVGDALELPLTVEPEPAAVNRSAVYMTLQPQEHQSLAVLVPRGTASGGGITVAASTSLLTETLDAAAYLVDYPHGCAEQTSSAILGLLAYRELRAHGVAAPNIPDKTLQERITRLLSMQTAKGGFAYWPGEGLADNPHVSPYATWVLVVARKAGVNIPDSALDLARKYVSARLSQNKGVSRSATLSEVAFAAQVLVAAGGQPPPAVIDAVYGKRAELDAGGMASLLLAIHGLSPEDSRIATLTELLTGFVIQTPGAARIDQWSHANEFDPFGSKGRTYALVTLALATARPDHPLVAKLARGLLDLRTSGRWRNTQENAYALLVAWELARRESQLPHTRLRVDAGASILLDSDLTTASPASALLSRDALSISGNQASSVDLLLNVLAGGPVHVRVASEWNMTTVQPRSAGIELQRVLSVNGKNVTSVKERDIVWCDVQLRNRVPLRYVVVTLPLPAGVEGNLDFAGGSGARPESERPSWVSHQEIWKDRIVLFADTLEPGEHLDSLPLRAVTPGDFVVPAAASEAMYEPEIQALTPVTRLRVSKR